VAALKQASDDVVARAVDWIAAQLERETPPGVKW
jgi:hypothetical protein